MRRNLTRSGKEDCFEASLAFFTSARDKKGRKGLWDNLTAFAIMVFRSAINLLEQRFSTFFSFGVLLLRPLVQFGVPSGIKKENINSFSSSFHQTVCYFDGPQVENRCFRPKAERTNHWKIKRNTLWWYNTNCAKTILFSPVTTGGCVFL